MTSKAYDRFKFLALVILPGLGALYFGVAEIWGLPYATQVVGTLTVLDTFLGLLVKRASTIHQRQDDIAPVIADLNLLTDFDGVPTGKFRLRDDAFNGITFEDGQLVSFRIRKRVENT